MLYSSQAGFPGVALPQAPCTRVLCLECSCPVASSLPSHLFLIWSQFQSLKPLPLLASPNPSLAQRLSSLNTCISLRHLLSPDSWDSQLQREISFLLGSLLYPQYLESHLGPQKALKDICRIKKSILSLRVPCSTLMLQQCLLLPLPQTPPFSPSTSGCA